MTAPDPGLTDLIAAHRLRPDMWEPKFICWCGDWEFPGEGSDSAFRAWAAHVALVVEQHTNGRITELEADSANWKGRYDDAKQVIESATVTWTATIRDRNEWRERALAAEAAIARVEKLQRDLFQQGGNLIAQWGAARLIRAALQEEFIRAALEGEQQ